MLETIGKKIGQIRETQTITLEELASAAKIDPAQLAKIESGEVNPSLSTLIKIARRLGVRVGTILDGSEHANPVVTTSEAGRIVFHGATITGQEHTKLNFISLAQNKKDRNMEPYIVNINFNPADSGKASSHEGEEFLYVLEGDLVLYYGNQTYKLAQGDSIYYDSIVPHIVSSGAEGQVAKVLAVTYEPS